MTSTIAFVGSVAITENISFVVNRLGWTTIAPHNDPAVGTHTGFSEFMLGPKFTFLRNETSGTVAAVGLTFDIPTGSGSVFQNTGHTQLDPYFSIAQNFGKNPYGSFNFMNTTGYTFRTDNTRSEAFFSSFHLDYDMAGLKRFWPFVELNWRHYTRSGGANDIGFEGNDLANFGAAAHRRAKRLEPGARHAHQAQQLHLLGRRRRVQRAAQRQRAAPGRVPPDDRFDLPLLTPLAALCSPSTARTLSRSG